MNVTCANLTHRGPLRFLRTISQILGKKIRTTLGWDLTVDKLAGIRHRRRNWNCVKSKGRNILRKTLSRAGRKFCAMRCLLNNSRLRRRDALIQRRAREKLRQKPQSSVLRYSTRRPQMGLLFHDFKLPPENVESYNGMERPREKHRGQSQNAKLQRATSEPVLLRWPSRKGIFRAEGFFSLPLHGNLRRRQRGLIRFLRGEAGGRSGLVWQRTPEVGVGA